MQPAVLGWHQRHRCDLSVLMQVDAERERESATCPHANAHVTASSSRLKTWSSTSLPPGPPSPSHSRAAHHQVLSSPPPDRIPSPWPSHWSSPSSLAPSVLLRLLRPSPTRSLKSNHVTFPSLLRAHPNKDLEPLIPSQCSEH